MPEKMRSIYGGVPARAQADVAARRHRAEAIEAAVPPPPPASAPFPLPLSIKQRLRALEKQVAALVGKMDLVLDVLGASDEAISADVPRWAPVKKT